MRWKQATPLSPGVVEEWCSWFAWRPVCIDGYWIWLERVERQLVLIEMGDGHPRRFKRMYRNA